MEQQKKPWEEMTEEERQAIRESWKLTLPEEYDVVFVGDFDFPTQNLVIPGNAYVPTSLYSIDVANINIDGDFIVDGDVNCGDVTVHGSLIVKGEVDCLEVNVDDLFDCYDVESWYCPIKAADFVCRSYEEEY